MHVACPRCEAVLEYSGPRPAFCSQCGHPLHQPATPLPSTTPDLVAMMVLWLVALVAMLLTFTEMAHPYYQRHQQKPAQQ